MSQFLNGDAAITNPTDDATIVDGDFVEALEVNTHRTNHRDPIVSNISGLRDIFSSNSGAIEPTTIENGMLWYDTAHELKMRVNAAWDPIVGTTLTQSLSNKTLTAPVLSGNVTGTYTLAGTPTIASPTLSGTIIGTYTLDGTITIDGATVTSNFVFEDTKKIALGTGSVDALIYSDGTNAVIDLVGVAANFEIRADGGTQDAITVVNGATNAFVRLFFNGVQEFETVSGGIKVDAIGELTGAAGVTITGGALAATTSLVAANDLDIGAFEMRALTFESDQATGAPPLVVASTTKVVNLNVDQLDGLDSSAFLRATAGTIKSVGNLVFNDNVKIALGTNSVDGLIYSDGTNAIIDLVGATANFEIRADGGDQDAITVVNGAANSYVSLFFNGTEEIKTVSGGIAADAITELTSTLGVTIETNLNKDGYLIPGTSTNATPVANALYQQNVVKGWINIDGVTGAPAERDSFNVASIGDGGDGRYEIFWVTDFANDDYAVSIACTGDVNLEHTQPYIDTMAVGSVIVIFHITTNSATRADQTEVHIIAVGEQP